MHYYYHLAEIHAELRPRRYVEIGVARGRSLAQALPDTFAVGIDPEPQEFAEPIRCSYELFELTSNEFFQQHDLTEVLGGPFDLAFIDGMHLFEYALRDFINLERHASPQSTMLAHDCRPLDAVTASRERTTKVWTGDVWKLIPCLREHRPELEVEVLDAAPSGLARISGLDPSSSVLHDRYDEICAQFVPLGFEAYAP